MKLNNQVHGKNVESLIFCEVTRTWLLHVFFVLILNFWFDERIKQIIVFIRLGFDLYSERNFANMVNN